jgi:hypothetical protein
MLISVAAQSADALSWSEDDHLAIVGGDTVNVFCLNTPHGSDTSDPSGMGQRYAMHIQDSDVKIRGDDIRNKMEQLAGARGKGTASLLPTLVNDGPAVKKWTMARLHEANVGAMAPKEHSLRDLLNAHQTFSSR